MRKTTFRMLLWKCPRLRKRWLWFIEYLGKKCWNASGKLNHYYHESTAFYFMLGVGGEEQYRRFGRKLTQESPGGRYIERERQISN